MIKNIDINNLENNKNIIVEKEKSQRKLIQKEKWDFDETFFEEEKQLDFMKNIQTNKDLYPDIYKRVIQQIQRKITSYKSQDREKGLFNQDKFIDISYIFDLLKECDYKCFYCNHIIKILYKLVREEKQWSVERIDNKFGHNKENVTIACLECNLRRKTMYHERFKFTKQLTIIKKQDK